MSLTTTRTSYYVTELLNGTIHSVKSIIPIQFNIKQPNLLRDKLEIDFGVLIGVTGDMKAKLILSGNNEVFTSIGQSLFGMSLEDEMLTSFKGELGNMIVGNLSTNIGNKGINTDITAPTIIEGNTSISGYKKGIQITFEFQQIGSLNTYLLLD